MNNKKVIKSGNQVTCIFNGTIFTSEGDLEFYHKAVGAETEEEIRSLFVPELYAKEKAVKEEREKVQKIIDGFDILVNTGEFEVREGSVYMKGINRSMPELLVNRLTEAIGTDEYESLKKFWLWVCLNPRAEVADSLFSFLTNNHLRVNSQGFFYALRNVVTVSKDTSLVKFVSEEYTTIKMRKKGPGNYLVIQNPENDKDYRVIHQDKYSDSKDGSWYFLGNLKEMYNNLPNMEENRYTDAHTHSFDIRIGQRVSMNPEDCNWNTADCGHAGLHFTMNEIHYVGCGDTSVIMLINPAKVVGIGRSKGRCYEYLPICTIDRDKATQFLRDGDFDTLEMEAEFVKEELEGLEQKVRENFAVEAKKHSFNLPQISTEEIKKIVLSLQDAKQEISSRVNNIENEDLNWDNDSEDYWM